MSYYERKIEAEKKLAQMLAPKYLGWFTAEEIEMQREAVRDLTRYAMGE